MAQITIIGRLTSAGKLGNSKTGKPVLEVSMADNFKDATTFYTLEAWEGMASEVAAFTSKDLIEVQGNLKPGQATAYVSEKNGPMPRLKVSVNSVKRYEKRASAPAVEADEAVLA